MDGVMAQKEIQKKDKTDTDTKEMIVKEEIIKRNKPQSESYLKTIARRSKAGFERVHIELLRKYKESTDMADKWSEKRMSFRKSKKPSHRKNTEAAVHFRCGTFKSYICSTDEGSGHIASIEEAEETDFQSISSHTQTLPCKIRHCNDRISENHPVVSKETEPIKRDIHSKSSAENAYLPNSTTRKLANSVQKTNADTGNTTNVQDPLYDIPPTKCEDKSDNVSSDPLYIPMDGAINRRTSPDGETGDYMNVLSKEKEPNRKANGSKRPIESANLPHGDSRKLVDRPKKTNAGIANKTDVKAPIYDIPPQQCGCKSSPNEQDKYVDDSLYVPMAIGATNEEAGNYTNIDETLKFKKPDTSSGIYVNCPNKICKQSYEKEDTVEIYCSTEIFSENVTYATVNKASKMKGTGKIEKETPLDDPNDYINCDEIDITVPQCLLQQNGNSIATANDKDDKVVKTTKQGFKRQSTVPSNVKYEENVYINQDNFVAMPPPPEPEFYSYSIDEVEEALKSCALPHIAKVCKEERLDGSFFRDIDKEVLKEEPFRMNCFYIGKFFRVVNGWRPRRMTLDM